MHPADPHPSVVAGEDRGVLREAALCIRTRDAPDGSLELEGEVPPHLARPFVRAHRRVADGLAADDAAAGREVRFGGRLDADALVALLLRITDGDR